MIAKQGQLVYAQPTTGLRMMYVYFKWIPDTMYASTLITASSPGSLLYLCEFILCYTIMIHNVPDLNKVSNYIRG